MILTKEKTVLKLKEIQERYDVPVNRLTSLIRQGKLKAVKSGKEYVVTLTEIHRYLGIETTSESLEREIYIKELESKIKNYEIQMKTLKNCLSMMENVVACG